MTDYNDVGSLLARIDELERRIATQETAPRLSASGVGAGGITVHDGGSITIQDGGNLYLYDGSTLEVRYPTSLGGGVMARFGTLSGGYGIECFRGDGTKMFSTKANTAGTAHENIMYDNSGTPVAGTAMTTAKGLTWPALASGFGSRWAQNWPFTNSATFQDMYEGYLNVYHDSLYVDSGIYADASTTGEARIMTYDASLSYIQLGSTFSFGAGFSRPTFNGLIPYAVGTGFYAVLQLRRTGGTGNVYGSLYALQSYGS